MDPLYIILTGLVLVLIGVAVPFLMVLDVIAPTYLLGFISFTCSLSGVLLGVVGASRHRHGRGRWG